MTPRRARSPLAASCALLLAGLAFATAGHTESASAPCGVAPSPERVLQRLNAARVHGAACHPTDTSVAVEPLRWNQELAAVAAAQARDMAVRGRMEHRDRENRNLVERLAVVGYRFKAAAENLAFGYESLDEVVDAWLVSESHCVNLMNAKLLEFGLACSDSGVAAVPGDGRYWTMVLGTPPRRPDIVASK